MSGYRFCTDDEQLRLFDRLEDAIALRKPVRVSYFKEKRVKVWSARANAYVEKPSGLFVKVTRVVEPYELHQTIAGNLIVKAMDRSPKNAERPEPRTIRLDRIAFSHAQRRPLMRVMFTGRWLCPSPLDDVSEGGSAPMTLPLPATV